jgi:tyrosinase
MDVQGYWDWTLDASDLASSPIWDGTSGFGGDGESDDEGGIFGGRCVTDGPFANSTRYWRSKSNGEGFDILEFPHCLSRGFANGDKKESLQARITLDAIETVLNQPTYLDFFDDLEVRTHNAIPQFIRGDFYGMTAPNGEFPRATLAKRAWRLTRGPRDPVFFLHHAQVDRLWWIWQQKDPMNRMMEYLGPAENTRLHPDGATATPP